MTKIGVIGLGFVGAPLAKFLSRKNEVITYSLDKTREKDKIKDCEIVFICVPTPTTEKGQDLSAVREALSLCRKTVVIKSTVLPNTCKTLQKEFPRLKILHSPEFLREKSAEVDTLFPLRNIVGGEEEEALKVLALLPKAKTNAIVSCETAELIKYFNNFLLTSKVICANIMYEVAQETGADYETAKDLVGLDSRISPSHLDIVDQGGRGAGGHCFPKDLEALRQFYENTVRDKDGSNLLKALAQKNNALLIHSKKDIDIITKIYKNV